MEFEVGDMVRYCCKSNHETYIGIISDPDTITWFCDGVKEDVSNYEDFDLVRCTYGSGSGTVGIIVAFTDASYIVQLNNGEYYPTHRLEVLSAGG